MSSAAVFLRQYVERVDNAVNNDSAVEFAQLLRIAPPEYDLKRQQRGAAAAALANASGDAVRSACAALEAPYDEMVAERVMTVVALCNDKLSSQAQTPTNAFQ
jgi:hypothetical protein